MTNVACRPPSTPRGPVASSRYDGDLATVSNGRCDRVIDTDVEHPCARSPSSCCSRWWAARAGTTARWTRSTARLRVAPTPVDAEAFETATPIKHVVFVIKENRTFDNMFGLFPARTASRSGWTRASLEPSHPRSTASRWTSGTATTARSRPGTRARWTGSRRSARRPTNTPTRSSSRGPPNYWTWASSFVLGDKFFASAQGPSFPNHLYTIAAQSGGTHENVSGHRRAARAPPRHRPVQGLGLRLDGGRLRRGRRQRGHREEGSPCFDFLTEGDLLTEAEIPWAYYAATQYQNGYLWSAYDAIRHIREDEVLAVPHLPGRRVRRAGPVGAAAARHVGDTPVRALRAPRVQHVPRRELDDRDRERGDGGSGLGLDRDLHHVGRLRWVLRPRPAAAGRRLRLRDPGAVARHQPVREGGVRDPRAGRVLQRASVHRGQLAALPAHAPGPDATPLLSAFDFEQAPEPPSRCRCGPTASARGSPTTD